MIARLICRLVGHKPFIYDRLDDGTPIRGCDRCGTYVVRDVSDSRPDQKNTHERFRIARSQQARARWAALSLMRRMPKSDSPNVVKEKVRSA